MIRAIILVCLAITGILLLFCVLSSYSKRRNRFTAAQVADAIEKHLMGKEGQWDWDTFTSLPINNDRLDAIRKQCIKLDDEAPEIRMRELRKIIDDLRRPDPIPG